jgi:hypothetical protein
LQKLDPLKWATFIVITLNIIGFSVYFLLASKPQQTETSAKKTAEFADYQPKRFIQSLPGFDQPQEKQTTTVPQKQSNDTQLKAGEVRVADIKDQVAQEAVVEDTKPVSSTTNWESIDEYLDLPLAWQKELPDMTFAAHVYTESQSTSFIIVNGQTLSQGDKLGEITLMEIHEKGAIFRMRGRQFKVKF